jgi:hypothetical protein
MMRYTLLEHFLVLRTRQALEARETWYGDGGLLDVVCIVQ